MISSGGCPASQLSHEKFAFRLKAMSSIVWSPTHRLRREVGIVVPEASAAGARERARGASSALFFHRKSLRLDWTLDINGPGSADSKVERVGSEKFRPVACFRWP